MTNKEIYNTIFSYWQEIYVDKNPTLAKALWRMKEGKKIGDVLLSYTHLCMRAGKEVRM